MRKGPVRANGTAVAIIAPKLPGWQNFVSNTAITQQLRSHA